MYLCICGSRQNLKRILTTTVSRTKRIVQFLPNDVQDLYVLSPPETDETKQMVKVAHHNMCCLFPSSVLFREVVSMLENNIIASRLYLGLSVCPFVCLQQTSHVIPVRLYGLIGINYIPTSTPGKDASFGMELSLWNDMGARQHRHRRS